MLNFIDNYYEVTESNKELLRRKIIEEDIREYNDEKLDTDWCVKVGHVLGNNWDGNPKHTGCWYSRNAMPNYEIDKITTVVSKQLMKME